MTHKQWVKHIHKEGSRTHVLSWDAHGAKCSVPNCEINKYRLERIKKEEELK